MVVVGSVGGVEGDRGVDRLTLDFTYNDRMIICTINCLL